MVTRTKYKAKPVFWDTQLRSVLNRGSINIYRHKGRLNLPRHITRFDSQHEFKVYLELCRMFSVKTVVRQYPVEIIPPGCCYRLGKSWRIDFAIANSDPFLGFSHYVEAKGAFLPEFAHTLASFEARYDKRLTKLIIVFTDSIPKNNKVIKSLLDSPFRSNLLTLEELKQLKTLP